MEIHDKIVFKHNGVKLEYKPSQISDKYYLSTGRGGNDKIFNLLGIEDRFAFCEKEIGYSIEIKTTDFPEVNSLEDLEKIVEALYKRILELSKPKFNVGDIVIVVKREGDAGDYPCSYTDEMLQYENRIFTINEVKEMSIPFIKHHIPRLKYEEPFFYTVEGNDWNWSSAMLRKVEIIKHITAQDIAILADTGEVNIGGVPSYIDTHSPAMTDGVSSNTYTRLEKSEESEYKLIFKFNHLKF